MQQCEECIVHNLVGLFGNFEIVEQLVLLVVEQLLNPIVSSNCLQRKSLEGRGDEKTFSF